MKRILLLSLAFLLLGAQDCSPPAPPPNAYCAGAVVQAAPTGLDALIVDLLTGAETVWNTIVGGVPSTDRRSTVWVNMPGQGYCSGVIIGPHTVLTAAHCKGPSGYHIYLDRNKPNYYLATGTVQHPDYTKYENDGDREARKADLRILYVAETLPEPYTSVPYSSKAAQHCTGLVAQGWGQTEAVTDPDYVKCPDGQTRCLRETPYTVEFEYERNIVTLIAEHGAICFGDSGGPLYATMSDGSTLLAGITSTTGSSDCLVSSTHTNVINFWEWIRDNINPPGTL